MSLLIMLDKYDTPQWYDIVHFEHKLSWHCFGLPQMPHTNEFSIIMIIL